MSGLIVLLLAALVWVFARQDDPPPDDSAMLPRWSDKGGDANPLAVFYREIPSNTDAKYAKLAGTLKWEKEENRQGSETAKRQFIETQVWVFAAFDKLMATRPDTWQWPDAETVCQPSQSNRDSKEMLSVFSAILGWKAALLRRDGKTEEAVRLSLQAIRYSRGLQRAEGGLWASWMGTLHQKHWEALLAMALRSGNADPNLLRECARVLEEAGAPRREEFQFGLRTEYLEFKHLISQRGRADMARALQGVGTSRWEWPSVVLLTKPNRTLATCVHLNWPVVKGLDSSWGDGLSANRSARQFLDDYMAGKVPPSLYYDGNAGGILLLKFYYDMLLGERMETVMGHVMFHEQARIMVALRLFELEQGRLPETLDKLVPTYLKEVPEDIFAGKPMAWSHTNLVLYSVGKDGKDDGGDVQTDKPHRGEDLGMHYWWQEPIPSWLVEK